jgi:hypothetical protein
MPSVPGEPLLNMDNSGTTQFYIGTGREPIVPENLVVPIWGSLKHSQTTGGALHRPHQVMRSGMSGGEAQPRKRWVGQSIELEG